jgi:SsrA-binding protein
VARDAAAGDRVVTTNRRAFHDYFIDEKLEAGVVLTGTEIKSIRAGKVTLTDGFARVREGEAWLENVYVAPYEHGSFENPDPRRRRKLLLRRGQIADLGAKTQQKGLTLVPLKVYLKRGLAKVELGLARGKHTYDKRHALAEREAKREIERAIRARD